MRLKPDYSIEPGLASKAIWADPKTLVLDIRQGVRFWNGRPLTVDDVVYSMKRNMDPAVQPVTLPRYSLVRSIVKSGPHQVTVRFKQHDNEFVPSLATPAGAVSEKEFTKRAGKSYGTSNTGIMCSGPFSFASWSPGEKLTIKRNGAYWDKNLRPKARTVEFQFISDPSTLTSALLSGEIDGSYEIPTGSINTLGNTTEGSLHFGPSALQVTAKIGSSATAVDPRVRRAINLALDKNAFVKSVLQGAGQPLSSLTPPFVWKSNKEAGIYQSGYEKPPGHRRARSDSCAQAHRTDPAEAEELPDRRRSGQPADTAGRPARRGRRQEDRTAHRHQAVAAQRVLPTVLPQARRRPGLRHRHGRLRRGSLAYGVRTAGREDGRPLEHHRLQRRAGGSVLHPRSHGHGPEGVRASLRTGTGHICRGGRNHRAGQSARAAVHEQAHHWRSRLLRLYQHAVGGRHRIGGMMP
ncbi:ABC transporter substrate-binding protein [Streptomyces sp. NBC_00063]